VAEGPGAARLSIRALIADDQALVRAGFRMILDAEEDLEIVGRPPTAARRWSSRGGLRPMSS